MKKTQRANSVVGGVIWKFAERILTQGVAFLVSLVLARLLTPDDYGTVALILVFINLADVFVTSGFSTALIQKKGADDTDFSTMFYCSFFCSLIIYGVFFFTAPLIASFYKNPELTLIVRVFALRIPLSVYFAIQSAWVSRNMQFRIFFFSGLIAQIISGVLGIGMALAGFGVWALIAQYFAATIVSTIVLCFMVPWHPKRLFSLGRAKSLMKYGSKILAADFSGTFFNELRSLIIGRVYTESDLAFYNKGQQLPQLLSSNLNTTIMTVLFPAMANEAEDITHIKAMARKSLQCLSYIVFPVLLGLAAVMSPLIDILYTNKWQSSSFFGQIYCIGYAVGSLGYVPLQVLKAIGKSGSVLKLEFIKKPVYLALLIIGVYFNVPAIAVTMLIFEFYGTTVNLLQLKRHINYSLGEILKDLLPSFLLAALMSVSVYFITFLELSNIVTIALQVIIGAIIYIGGSLIIKPEGFNFALSLIKRFFKKENQI